MMIEKMIIKNIELPELIALKTDLCRAMLESRTINFPNEQEFNVDDRFNSLCDYMKKGQAKVSVAYIGARFAGYAWFFKAPNNRIHLNEIDILQEAQGEHIGTALIKHIENYAKTINCSQIELYCMETNVRAQKFYDSNHFNTEKRLLVKQL